MGSKQIKKSAVSFQYSLEDVPEITIRDNGEPLVDVRDYCPQVTIRLGAERMQIEQTAYLRRSVASMLREAQDALPKGMSFVIRDAWRPAYVQCAIYFDFLAKSAHRFPNVPILERKKEVEKYVAPWKGRNASGHMSGGAIDLRILDKNGHLLPMRSTTLSYQENARFDHELLPTRQRNNRAVLARAMTAGGFSNYPLEFWHWTFGDFYWAKREGRKTARYAPVADHLDMYAHRACPCGSGDIFQECHAR